MPNNDPNTDFEDLIGSPNPVETKKPETLKTEIDNALESTRLLGEGVELSPEAAEELGAEIISLEEAKDLEGE